MREPGELARQCFIKDFCRCEAIMVVGVAEEGSVVEPRPRARLSPVLARLVEPVESFASEELFYETPHLVRSFVAPIDGAGSRSQGFNGKTEHPWFHL